MAEVADAIYTRLAADATLTAAQPGGLGFGVYRHWLSPDISDTAPAFTGPGGSLNRSIVVLDGGEVSHPSPRGGREWRLWDSFPTTHLFAQAHSSGKAAIDAALLRMETLLIPWSVTLPSGQPITFEPDSRVVLEDSEQFPGFVVTVARWRATGARKVA